MASLGAGRQNFRTATISQHPRPCLRGLGAFCRAGPIPFRSMSHHLHIWTGAPKSLREAYGLNYMLARSIPAIAGQVSVLFKEQPRPISALATGYTRSEATRRKINDKAMELGVETATAMFGVTADIQGSPEAPPKGLVYLGTFQADKDVREAEQ